jgi:hypothetical protein
MADQGREQDTAGKAVYDILHIDKYVFTERTYAKQYKLYTDLSRASSVELCTVSS